jgi:hypothetical protein
VAAWQQLLQAGWSTRPVPLQQFRSERLQQGAQLIRNTLTDKGGAPHFVLKNLKISGLTVNEFGNLDSWVTGMSELNLS